MKKKKKSDSTQVVSKSPYKTVKTSLKSILLNYNDIQPEINKLVIKCNDIVVQTYQFIRLYFLKQYHDNKDLPIINEKFFLYALKTQGTRDTRGKKAKDDTLIKELESFYETEFKSLVDNDKFDLKNLSASIRYRQKAESGELMRKGKESKYRFKFHNPQRAISPGQSLVIYDGEVCIGGGVIVL